ncbi:MAG TPA: hypothetical protein PKH95_00875 [Candidatus Magasanikbacteria bacterium]|nr:hypothetical protein [Candidatus Magasanikbacteria bacterium]
MDFYSQKNNLTQRKSSGIAKDIPEMPALKKNGYKKYEDPTGMFSNKQLNFAAWYVQNRMLLYRLLVGFLALFSVITLIYSVLRVAWIVIVDMPRDKRMMEQMTQSQDYSQIRQLFAPQPLLLEDTQILTSGVGKYDAWSAVINPNTKHIAYFDYYFSFNGENTEKKSGFVLPQQTKLLVASGLNENYGTGLILENISFKRVDPHLFPDPLGYIEQRSLFSVSDFEFRGVLHPEGANANIIKFDLTNDSPFHYYDPMFAVEFRNGGTTVAVAEFRLERFESLQKRNLDLRNFVDNIFIDEAVIYPSINYFEKSEYFEPVR